MEYLGTFVLTMSAALLGGMARKYNAQRSGGALAPLFTYNTVNSAVCALVLLLWGGFGATSTYTVLLGILFGLTTSVQMITYLKALEIGPMSYTTIIISCSTLMSALSGAIFWNEKLAWAHIVGLVLMLVSFALSIEKKSDEKKSSTLWLLLCLVAFLGTGMIGIMQKIHQTSPHKGELNSFLIVAFLTAVVCNAALLCYTKHRDGTLTFRLEKPDRAQLILIGVMVGAGICAAINNKLNLFLSGVIPSAVFFPIVNGGNLVLTTIVAVLVFRERLSKMQWIGVAAGILSVLFLCNPFR